jgi:hypothetical protein
MNDEVQLKMQLLAKELDTPKRVLSSGTISRVSSACCLFHAGF